MLAGIKEIVSRKIGLMLPKVTNTLLFYCKFVTAALVLTANPNFAWAKALCITESSQDNSCVSEQSEDFEDQNIFQDSNAFAIEHLYYSGGVLHNKERTKDTVPTQKLEKPETLAEMLVTKEIVVTNLNGGTSSASVYSGLRGIFQNIDEVGRKSIQKCLRFGTYDAKVDGIWGEQTRNAISNFKSTASKLKEKADPSLFSKIKNAFSRKAVCHTLLVNTFG